MFRLAVITVLLVLLVPSGAQASRVGELRHGATTGLGNLEMPGVPTPPRLTVRQGRCPYDGDVLGCADVENGEVFAPRSDRFTTWHEIGHVFDYQVLSDLDRAWFTGVLGFRHGAPWWMTADDDHETESPSEFFADAYAACALHRSPRGERRGRKIVLDWPIGYGYLPTAHQHRRVCAAINGLR